MSPAPTPVCAFDIAPDGTATPCAPDDPKRPGWRWLHFDLGAEGLAAWLDQAVPETVAEALLLPETRPRFDALAEGALINLRGVNLNPGAHPEDMVGLRLWVSEARVISLRKRKVMAVDALRARALKGQAPTSPLAFVQTVTEGLTRRIEEVSLELEDQVDALEDTLVAGGAVNPQEVLILRQTLIKLKRFIGPQKEALTDLAQAPLSLDAPTPEAPTQARLIETANRAARTVEALEAARDRLGVMQDHLEARVAATQGKNGYVLSVIAAIFLPLGFLTGLFGVNVAGMPGIETPWAFGVLCLTSTLLGVALYLLFRWLKWL